MCLHKLEGSNYVMSIVYTESNMECPKKYVKDDFFMWWHLHFYLKCPKIEELNFRCFCCLKISHVIFIWNAPWFWKCDISNISNIKKCCILIKKHVINFNKKHVINFKTEKESKLKFFENVQMLSHDKIHSPCPLASRGTSNVKIIEFPLTISY